MRVWFLEAILHRFIKRSIVLALLGSTAFAQAVSMAKLGDGLPNSAPADSAPTNSGLASSGAVMASPVASPLPEAPRDHRFWDNENRALFATVAALSAADFAITRANLQSGGKELNPVTRLFTGSTAGLALNFAGETASIIGLSYYFHKTGHHQLERITSMLNIGASSFALAYDFSHR